MDAMKDDKYPEVLVDLRDDLEELLTDHGVEAEEAKQVAFAATEKLREKWSGMAVYIPKARDWILSQRDLEIYRRYNGDNLQWLCREYQLTEQRLYQIIAKVRAEQIKKRQMRLSGF